MNPFQINELKALKYALLNGTFDPNKEYFGGRILSAIEFFRVKQETSYQREVFESKSEKFTSNDSFKRLASESSTEKKTFSYLTFRGFLCYLLLDHNQNFLEKKYRPNAGFNLQNLKSFLKTISIDSSSSSLDFNRVNEFIRLLQLTKSTLLDKGDTLEFDEFWNLNQNGKPFWINNNHNPKEQSIKKLRQEEYLKDIRDRFKTINLSIDRTFSIELDKACKPKLITQDKEYLKKYKGLIAPIGDDQLIAIRSNDHFYLFEIFEIIQNGVGAFICSDGGAGKSTTLKMGVDYCAQNAVEGGLPIYINLQGTKNSDLYGMIKSELEIYGLAIREMDKIVLFIDSVDEYGGDLEELFASMRRLKGNLIDQIILAGRFYPASLQTQEFVPFELKGLFKRDRQAIFDVALGDDSKKYRDIVEGHRNYEYLSNPLFCTLVVSFLKREIDDSGVVNKESVDQLFWNKGLLLNRIVVDSYLQEYERKSSRLVRYDDWLALKREQIYFLSFISYQFLKRDRANFLFSNAEILNFQKDCNLPVHSRLEYSIDFTIQDFRNHGVVGLYEGDVFFMRPEYHFLFVSKYCVSMSKINAPWFPGFLGFEEMEYIKDSWHHYESIIAGLLDLSVVEGYVGYISAEFDAFIKPNELKSLRLSIQLASARNLPSHIHLHDLKDDLLNLINTQLGFFRTIEDQHQITNGRDGLKEQGLLYELLTLLIDSSLDENNDYVLEYLLRLSAPIKDEILIKLFRRMTREYTYLSRELQGEIASNFAFKTKCDLQISEFSKVVNKEYITYCGHWMFQNPTSMFESLFREDRCFEIWRIKEIINVVHQITILSARDHSRSGRYTEEIAKQLVKCFITYLEKIDLIKAHGEEDKSFYKLAQTIGTLERIRSVGFLNKRFSRQLLLKFKVEKSKAKKYGYGLFMSMVLSEVSFFNEFEFLLFNRELKVVYMHERSIEIMFKRISTLAGYGVHPSYDDSIQNLRRLYSHNKVPIEIKQLLYHYSKLYQVHFI